MKWHRIVETVKGTTFRISTQEGHGTGFLLAKRQSDRTIAIATAFHVIQNSFEWNLPIKVEHSSSGDSKLLTSQNSFIVP